MNSTKSLPKPKGKVFSSLSKLNPFRKKGRSAEDVREKEPEFNKRMLHFDLFAQLSYMAAIATAGVPRAGLFLNAAGLPYVSAAYFRNISRVARYLNVDYAEACRQEADRTKEEVVKGLLLRLGGALSSGEDERLFLTREPSFRVTTTATRMSAISRHSNVGPTPMLPLSLRRD